MKRIVFTAMGIALCGLLICSARAADEQTELELAAGFLLQQGIMTGDQNGELNLDAGLNRAELAVLLTRLSGGTEEVLANAVSFERECSFMDVPVWAERYVGYCVRNNLVTGYDSLHYGAAEPVVPSAACTVILRACGHKDSEGIDWNYDTACSYAMSLGWLSEPAARAAATTRGEIALLLYRALTGAHPADLSLAPQGTGDGCLTNGKPVTEENVLEFLRQLEQDWPQDTVWGTHKTPGTHKNEVPSTAANRIMDVYWVSEYYGCSGYAAMISSLIFGDDANPGRQLEDLSQIRPGDIVFIIDNSTGTVGHVRVAVESPNEINAFHYTDGNNGGVIHWPDREYLYGRENLDCYRGMNKACRLEAWTRYPESVPYTGNSVNAWPTGYRA